MESSIQNIEATKVTILPDFSRDSQGRFLNDSIDLFSYVQSGHMLHQCYIGEGLEYWNEFMRQSNDYYVTKDETNLILTTRDEISQIAQDQLNGSLHLVELGPGSRLGLDKTLTLCEALPDFSYFPCDWSEDSVDLAKAVIKEQYPHAQITGQKADFNRESLAVPLGGRRLVAIFGSSASNIPGFSEQGIPVDILNASFRNIRSNMQSGDILVFSIDQNQNGEMMEGMYSHPMHSAFSENILSRMKSELPVLNLDTEAFKYNPKWHPKAHLLSHDLVAIKDTSFQVGSQHFDIQAGERFSYSNSYKYPDYALNAVFNATNFNVVKKWVSPANTMSLFALRAV